MSDTLDLKALERKAYLSYADDGLLELFLGLAIIVFGLGLQLGQESVGFLIPICLVALGPLLKRAITLPRLGFVKYGPERVARIKRTMLFFAAFFTFTALAGVAAMWSFENTSLWRTGPLQHFGFLPLGIIGALTMAGLAYWEQVRRYLVYIVLIPAVLIAGPLLHIPRPPYLMFLGAAIMIPGIVVFADFLRKHPKIETGERNAEG